MDNMNINSLENETKKDSIWRKYAGECTFFIFKVADAILESALRLYLYWISTHEDISRTEEEIQKRAAVYLVIYELVVNVPAILTTLFCGSWSDRVGRKLPVMICCCGTIFACLLYMLSMLVIPNMAIFLVLTGALIRGCFGNKAVITMALHSYISDVSTHSDRTHRLGSLLALGYFGFATGSFLGGALLEFQKYRYNSSFLAGIFLCSLCVFITALCVEESVAIEKSHYDDEKTELNEFNLCNSINKRHGMDEKSPLKDCNLKSDTERNTEHSRCSCDGSLEQPFRLSNIRDSLKVMFRKRENSLRLTILTLFTVIMTSYLCKAGEMDVTLLFVKRRPFNFTESMYGYVIATDYVCRGLILFILPLGTKFLNYNDMTLVIVGLVFKTARLFLLAVSFDWWQVYLAMVIGSPLSLIISGSKSAISKAVNGDEIGKTFSILSSGETLANLLGSLLFNYLYALTASEIFPGFIFVIDIGIHISLVLAACYLVRERMQVFIGSCCSSNARETPYQHFN